MALLPAIDHREPAGLALPHGVKRGILPHFESRCTCNLHHMGRANLHHCHPSTFIMQSARGPLSVWEMDGILRPRSSSVDGADYRCRIRRERRRSEMARSGFSLSRDYRNEAVRPACAARSS